MSESTPTPVAPAVPAPAFGEMSFEDAMRAAITPPSLPEEVPAPVTPPIESNNQPAAEVSPATPPDESKAAVVRRLLDLERAAVERQRAAEAKEAQIASQLKELEEYKRAKASYRSDPYGFVKALDPEFDTQGLAEDHWNAKLGDAAPEAFKARREAQRAAALVDAKYAELEQKFNARLEDMQRAQHEAAYHQYVGSVSAFLSSTPPELDLVSRYAKAAPDKAQAAVMKIAEKAASQGKLLSPAECAQHLNRELGALKSLFVDDKPKAAPPSVAPEPTSTIRNKDASVLPSMSAEEDERDFWRAVKAATAGREL